MRRLVVSLTISAFFFGCGSSSETESPPADTGKGDTAITDSAQTDSIGTDSIGTDSSDGGGDTTVSDTKTDTAGSGCGDKTCTSSELCVRTYTTGGACLSCDGDSAACPTGRHCAGGCCVPDVTTYGYECKPKPSGCGTPLSCGACSTGICSGGCPCESAEGTTVTCHCLAP